MASISAAALVGQHITQALRDGNFSQMFTPERQYYSLISLDPAEISTVRVNVLAWVYEEEEIARGKKALKVALNVEVARPLGEDEVAECDEMALLVEEVAGYLRKKDFSFPVGVSRIPPDNDSPVYAPQYEPSLIAGERLYFGVVALRFNVELAR